QIYLVDLVRAALLIEQQRLADQLHPSARELPDVAEGAVEAAARCLADLVDQVARALLADVLRELAVPALLVARRDDADAQLAALAVALDDDALVAGPR